MDKDYWNLNGMKVFGVVELIGMCDNLNGQKKLLQGTIFRKRDNVVEIEFEFDKVIINQDITIAEIEKYNPDFWTSWQIHNIVNKF